MRPPPPDQQSFSNTEVFDVRAADTPDVAAFRPEIAQRFENTRGALNQLTPVPGGSTIPDHFGTAEASQAYLDFHKHVLDGAIDVLEGAIKGEFIDEPNWPQSLGQLSSDIVAAPIATTRDMVGAALRVVNADDANDVQRGVAVLVLSSLGFKPVRKAVGTYVAEPIGKVLTRFDGADLIGRGTKTLTTQLDALTPSAYREMLDILPSLKGSKLTADGVETVANKVRFGIMFADDASDVRAAYGELGRIAREASPDLYRGLEHVSDETIGVTRFSANLQPSDTLYRTTELPFLTPDNRLSANEDSIGLVIDVLGDGRQPTGPEMFNGQSVYRPPTQDASEVSGLFFGKSLVAARNYQGEGMGLVEVSVRDLLEAGATFRIDAGGLFGKWGAYAVFDGTVPFKLAQ